MRVKISGLDPHQQYYIAMDIVPVDNKRYRYGDFQAKKYDVSYRVLGCWQKILTQHKLAEDHVQLSLKVLIFIPVYFKRPYCTKHQKATKICVEGLYDIFASHYVCPVGRCSGLAFRVQFCCSQEVLPYFIPSPVSGNYFLLTNKYENVHFLVLKRY